MSGGLNNSQKSELKFIKHMVSDVKNFNSTKYFELEEAYKKEDQDIYKIVRISRETAEKDYDNYLDKKIINLGGVFGIGFEDVNNGEGTVLGGVVSKMRAKAFNDQEFRKSFLAPSLSSVTLEYDKSLKKSFRDLERENKKAAKTKSGPDFSFGWD